MQGLSRNNLQNAGNGGVVFKSSKSWVDRLTNQAVRVLILTGASHSRFAWQPQPDEPPLTLGTAKEIVARMWGFRSWAEVSEVSKQAPVTDPRALEVSAPVQSYLNPQTSEFLVGCNKRVDAALTDLGYKGRLPYGIVYNLFFSHPEPMPDEAKGRSIKIPKGMKMPPGHRTDYPATATLCELNMPYRVRDILGCTCLDSSRESVEGCCLRLSDLDEKVLDPLNALKTPNFGTTSLRTLAEWYGNHPSGKNILEMSK